MKHKRNMVVWLGAIGALCMNLEIAAAQSSSVSGMYVFPKGKQTREQQQQDEGQCHSAAVEMTGFNPSAPQNPPPQSQGAPAGSGARGALRGAAGGGILGAARGRQQGQQQQAAQQQAAQQQQQAQRQEYQRAFTACIEARGYSVK